MRQVAPDLLFHPIFDEAEALAGVSNREVVHPPPEHRIDQVYYPVNRLRPVSAKHLFELAQKRRPLFELGHVMRPHVDALLAQLRDELSFGHGSNQPVMTFVGVDQDHQVVSESQPQEAEALASFQVHGPALFIIK
jgi:hypothetical protein